MAFRIKNKTLGISYSAAEAVRLREQAGIDAVVALVSAKGSIVMSAGRPAVVRGPNPQMVDGEDLVVPVTQMIPGLASVLGAALREAPGRRRSIRHAKRAGHHQMSSPY